MDSEASNQIQSVLHEAWKRCLVAVAWPAPGESGCGSGILIRGAEGQVGVLTAGHVAKDIKSNLLVSELGWEECPLTRTGTIEASSWLEAADAGFLFLRPALQDSLREAAVPLDQIADSGYSYQPNDHVVVTGFPSHHGAWDGSTFWLKGLEYWTQVGAAVDHPAVKWLVGYHSEYRPSLDRNVKEAVKMGPAQGASGGAVWGIQRLGPNTIWTRARQAKLIGVVSQFDPVDFQLWFTPVATWRGWLDHRLEEALRRISGR